MQPHLMKSALPLVLNVSIVSAMAIMGNNVMAPVLPQYALSFEVSLALVGWAVSAFALARLFTDLPAGVLSDRFGEKRVMELGLGLIILSSPICALANNFWMLIAGRIVGGIGSAVYMTSALTCVAHASTAQNRGRLMAIYSTVNMMGLVFGPTVGGFSASYFGLRAPFWTVGILGVIGILATIPLKGPTGEFKAKKSSFSLADIRVLLSNRSFMLVGFAAFATFSLRSGIRGTLIPLYASLNLDLSVQTIGVILTISAIAQLLMIGPSGWISDKIGRKPPSLACLLLAAFSIMLISQQSNAAALMLVIAIYGISEGMQGATTAWPADLAPEGKMGSALGFYRVMGDLGMVVGPLVITYTAATTGGQALSIWPFVAAAAIPFLAAVLIIPAADPAAHRNKT
jgi:DHA1 family multidrug resistance protein-like MFS transporter